MDLGPQGVSGLHALQYKPEFKMNCEGMPDECHLGNRAVMSMLNTVKLFRLILLWLLHVNLLHGPDL